ncbi:MAG: multiheme c-type cytochrome [Campylobacterota bacterium]|nr:multiheme c-type cytochrome [Campylobacterota bacterium]
MKIMLIIFTIVTLLFGVKVEKVEEKYQKSKSCKACHLHIVRDWEQSWHAKSHYKNDEYFRASTDYVSRKTRKSLNSVKIKCAACHNPRISVTSTDMDYEIIAVMGLDKNSDINKATQSSAISEGINCVVCHNIDKIHDNKDSLSRGIHRVTWMKSGTMTGPYDDSNSPYHKVEQRDFMNKKSDKLCFVCHANDKAVKGLVFTDMQSEYKKGKKQCVDCHMGPQKMGVAATLRDRKGKVKKRKIRGHAFAGAHTQEMWKDALSLNLKEVKGKVIIQINNPQPHNIPSGFGSRELIIEISYLDGATNLDKQSISLTRHYTRRKGKPTIPHLAEKTSKDMSIPALGKKVLKIKKSPGASSVHVRLYYRLVNDEVRSILKLKDAIWSKKMLITSKSLELK